MMFFLELPNAIEWQNSMKACTLGDLRERTHADNFNIAASDTPGSFDQGADNTAIKAINQSVWPTTLFRALCLCCVGT
jgi:hypothetical protein